jgi:outer membrane protein assembly factor BamB
MRAILGWAANLILCFSSVAAAESTNSSLPPPPILAIFDEWYTYHYNGQRTGAQPWASALSDPSKVATLHVKWSGPGGPAAVAGPFVNTFTGRDQQHFVYRDKDGVIWDSFNYRGDNTWDLLQINVEPKAVDGAFVDTFTGHDQQHFAYRDRDGVIWDSFYCPDCDGDKWRLQKINNGGVTNGPLATAGPFVDTYAEHNQQHFAYLAANGEIWDAFYCHDCDGNKWRLQKINNGGVTSGPPAAAAPFVNVYLGHDQQHFVYRDKNRTIWDSFYCHDCDGDKWRLQKINNGGVTNGPPATADPFVDTYIVPDQPDFAYLNEQHFAYLAENGEIWDAFYCPSCDGGKWRLQEINLGGVGGAKAGAFLASPIVVNDTVFIGSDDGYFYALDAASGGLKWQYPRKPWEPPLHGKAADPFADGIKTSASYWFRPPNGAVIFSAQDPSLGVKKSDARLFALDAASGSVIWKTPIASITGDSECNRRELHQMNRYSTPLIFNGRAYVGIANEEYPVGIGRVKAVDLSNGLIDSIFRFQSVPDGFRGGGVWNGLATDGTGIYFTTGNVRTNSCDYPNPKPEPDHGLSMIRVDKDTGAIKWAFQPVPYELDEDTDWAAGATVMSTSCGELIASVQKDGWTWLVGPNGPDPLTKWSFPTGPWYTNNGFQVGDGTDHDDSGYRGPGAAWNDVFIVRTGGENLVHDNVTAGYGKLHALNACAKAEKDRVRWIADIPNNSGGKKSLGAPTVTGGIVFVGTDQGHLIVLADPSVVPATEFTCSNADYSTASDCARAGFNPMTPSLKPLANVSLPDGGSLGAIRSEAVLARGRVFVGTGNGHVYMLEP